LGRGARVCDVGAGKKREKEGSGWFLS
jgi:hypothetical protein